MGFKYDIFFFKAINVEQQPQEQQQPITNNYQELSTEQQPPSSPTPVATPTSTTSGGTASNAAFSYDDLFPALPANTSAPLGNTTAQPCVRVASSQKTQASETKSFQKWYTLQSECILYIL